MHFLLTVFFLFFFFNFLKYTCVPHPEPSSLLPPHTIPLGRPSAPAPSIQHRALNLDWHLVSYMTFHMFQCHSPKSSHPLPLPIISYPAHDTWLDSNMNSWACRCPSLPAPGTSDR